LSELARPIRVKLERGKFHCTSTCAELVVIVDGSGRTTGIDFDRGDESIPWALPRRAEYGVPVRHRVTTSRYHEVWADSSRRQSQRACPLPS
jgi:hypothetical protein